VPTPAAQAPARTPVTAASTPGGAEAQPQNTNIQIAELRKEVSDLKELVYGMGRILNTIGLISLETATATLGEGKPAIIAKVKAMSSANELENLLAQGEAQGKG